MILQLTEIAARCRSVVEGAERAGLVIDDSNVVDLCADNLPDNISLTDIRRALVVAGLASKFPLATSREVL